MEIRIPYVFKLTIGALEDCKDFKRFWFWTPLFSFGGVKYCGFGKSVWSWFEKYGLRLSLHFNPFMFYCFIGFNHGIYLDWKLRRLVKRMTPEQRQELKDILTDVLNGE